MPEPEAPACLIAAGGTAGHVLPALAVAEALSARGARGTVAGAPRGAVRPPRLPRVPDPRPRRREVPRDGPADPGALPALAARGGAEPSRAAGRRAAAAHLWGKPGREGPERPRRRELRRGGPGRP